MIDEVLSAVTAELEEAGARPGPGTMPRWEVGCAFDSLTFDWYLYVDHNGCVRLTPPSLPALHKIQTQVQLHSAPGDEDQERQRYRDHYRMLPKNRANNSARNGDAR